MAAARCTKKQYAIQPFRNLLLRQYILGVIFLRSLTSLFALTSVHTPSSQKTFSSLPFSSSSPLSTKEVNAKEGVLSLGRDKERILMHGGHFTVVFQTPSFVKTPPRSAPWFVVYVFFFV